MPIDTPTAFAKNSFAVIKRAFAQDDHLPLAEVVDENFFEKAFEDHAVDFGASEDSVDTPVIMRCLALLSMTTGMLIDMVQAAYSGKQTGETSLARRLFDELRPGDILVADCYLSAFFIVAACLQRGRRNRDEESS